MAVMKTVCIVGAGPSGLVAAKTLAHDCPKDAFRVTVFEKSHRIGGLWPIAKIDDGLVNPDMCVNQSRHTVSFSDLAWSDSAPQFPKAWQVGEYLEKYIETYPGYDIRLNARVIKAELEGLRWKVQVQDQSTESLAPEVHEFDHVIIGTGFFGKPRIPKILDTLPVPVVHSSQVRQLRELVPGKDQSSRPPSKSGKCIVVVGGQMSGVEIAAFIANQLSSAAHSIEESGISNVADYYISHVVQKPFWVMPFIFPSNPVVEVSPSEKISNCSPKFLPLDLVSYNLAVKPPGPLKNTSGHITNEVANLTHGFMKRVIGSDQSELAAEMAVQGESLSEPPRLAVSDQYHEYVRSGLIRLVQGKVVGGNTDQTTTIQIEGNGDSHISDDVAAVVFATGFDATPSIEFLPEVVLKDLEFDANSDKALLALNVHSTISKLYPSLGFVGFYRSPYWGVMEMQARYLGKLWTGDDTAQAALDHDETKEALIKLRNNERAAQFPMGDYAYLMESFSDILGIKRNEPEGSPEDTRTGIVLPARYTPANASRQQLEESAISIAGVAKTLEESTTKAKFVSRAIFRAMQGIWKLERSINSRRSDYPSGTLIGEAHFHPRKPTEEKFDSEYLYNESGEFVSPQGFRFTATRSYAYRYQESTDTLSAWFVKPKDNKTVDYLFHELEITIPDSNSTTDGQQPWRATSGHLCIKDYYNVKYEFWFRGAQLTMWTQEYTVNGPAKDYTIRNVYTRPQTKR